MKKRTKAQRSAAAKASWARRKAALGGPWPTPPSLKAAAAFMAGNEPPRLLAGNEPPRLLAAGIDAPNVEGYETLRAELEAAYAQSSAGKGKERHANGRPFHRQPIAELTRMHGPGFATGQAAKKAQEALGMLARGEPDRARAELHGAIVYLAAASMVIGE